MQNGQACGSSAPTLRQLKNYDLVKIVTKHWAPGWVKIPHFNGQLWTACPIATRFGLQDGPAFLVFESGMCLARR